MIYCLGLIGCPSEQERPAENTSPQNTTTQPESPSEVNRTSDPKMNFEENMKGEYAELDQNIQSLENKAEEIPSESKEEFDQMMQTLQRQKNVAKERLDALGASANEGWEQLKDSTEEALNDLKATYDQVAARFP